MKDPNRVRHSFNRSAETYDEHANIQNKIGLRLIEAIKDKNKYENILELGAGTGEFTIELCKHFNFKKLHAIDYADLLLNVLNKKIISFTNKNIETRCMNFDTLNLEESFNLIVANMAVHWSSDLAQLFKNCYRQLVKNGILAFSIPIAGTFDNLKHCEKDTFLEEIEIRTLLQSAGFKIIKSSVHTFKQTFLSIFEAFISLKAIGVTGIKRARRGLYGRSYLETITQSQSGRDQFILDYNIGLFTAEIES